MLPLTETQQSVHNQILKLIGGRSFSTFAYYNQFQKNLVRGLPNDWQCRAGSRYLYICEDGLVHWCSQQRGYPGIPLEQYTREHLDREFTTRKPCAPFCTISCVHQVAMIDYLREKPREALSAFFPPKQEESAGPDLPAAVRFLTWLFLPSRPGRRRILRRAALRLLRVR